MATEGTTFTPPCIGRVVRGHPGKLVQKRNLDTNTLITKPDGTPHMITTFGVAFAKADFMAHIWPWFEAEAKKGYPNGIPQRFSWKYKDGDTDVDRNQKPLRDYPGMAGCYIVNFQSELPNPPPIYRRAPDGVTWLQVAADEMKTGDYVCVEFNISPHVATGTRTPSLYVNPKTVLFMGQGDAIIGAAASDPNQAFANVGHLQLPPGATAPGGPPPMPTSMPGAPGMSAPMAPAPVPSAAPAAPGAPTSYPPHTAFVPTAPTAAAPVPTVPPPMAPVDPMAAATAAGWLPHPQSPGYFYLGQEVLTAADLAARYSAAPAAPGYPGAMPPR